MEGLAIKGAEVDILQDIWWGNWDGQQEELVAQAASALKLGHMLWDGIFTFRDCRTPSLLTPAPHRDAPASSGVQCGQTDSVPEGPYPGAMSATPATSGGGQQQQGVQGGGNPG
ncbi:hypothetical protein E4T56_gene2449 [Termitomyces sp. T112]|nr:hypothetical protein E4T56_gene2449 [Termitomyces sp. T112]